MFLYLSPITFNRLHKSNPKLNYQYNKNIVQQLNYSLKETTFLTRENWLSSTD